MFSITMGKGFQIIFENGWTASVQFGGGNYADNRYTEIGWDKKEYSFVESKTAEIAAYKNKKWHRFDSDDVKGYCTPAKVLEFLNVVAAKNE